MADLHHGRLWPNTCVPHDAISLTGRKGPYMRTRGRRRAPSHLRIRTAVVERRAHLRMRRKGNRGTRPPQDDEEVFLRLSLILRCEAIAEPRRIEAKPELI